MNPRITLALMAACVPVFAQTTPVPCPEAASLAVGATAEGSLSEADCLHRTAFPGTLSTPVKVYRLELTERTIVTFQLTSADFDPVLYLYNANRLLITRNNDVREGETASRVIASLPPGAYLIGATTNGMGAAGAFQLRTTSEARRDCAPVTLTLEQTIEGAFDSSTCRGVDQATGTGISISEVMFKFYRVQMPSRSVLDIKAETALANLLSVSNTTLFFSSRNGLVTASLVTGSYDVILSSLDQGTFTLTPRVTDLRTCEAVPLESGNPVEGALAEDDCRVLDYLVPSASSQFADPRKLTIGSPSVVTLTEQSGEMDTLLRLLDSQNRQITSNDDVSRDDTNSRLAIHLPAGEYTVLASSFDVAQGAYTLGATIEAPRECAPRTLTLDQAIEGAFDTEGCRLIDIVLFSQAEPVITPYRLEVPARRVAKLDLNVPLPARGAMTLVVPPGIGAFPRTTAAADGNAVVETMLPAATYTVALNPTTASEAPPAFTLRGALAEPRECPVEDLEHNTTAEGSLSADDCRFLDILPLTTGSNRSKVYRLTITERSRLTMRLESRDFIPLIALASADDVPLTIQAAQQPGPLTLVGTILPGTYRIIAVTAQGGLGAFTLRADVTADSGAAPSWQPTPE